MAISLEAKAQLAEQKKQCVFCKIISSEIQAQVVFSDTTTQAVLDIYPVVRGHTLFFPKEHYPILMYYEPEEIAPFYALLPQMVKSVKNAMVSTGVSLFMALGGAAGQQSPHFMIHIIPREPGDGFLNFLFKMRVPLSASMQQQMITQFPHAMKQYFGSVGKPFPEKGVRGVWLEEKVKMGLVLFEDSEVLVCAPGKGLVEGHIEIYSKVEQKFIEKLNAAQATHLFSIGAFISSVLFSVIQPQGTNLILKSGHSDDNQDGTLCLHVIPRRQGDSLQGLLWQPEQPKYDLAGIGRKVKDVMWNVKYVAAAVPVHKMEEKVTGPSKRGMVLDTTSRVVSNTGNEIDDAVRKLWK